MSANCVDVIAHNLYLGDKNAATDLELISKLELTHILSVDMVPLPQVVSSTFPNLAMHQISVADMVDEDLLSHFESAIRFIKEGVTRGAILVHCYHGVSRSATLTLAYLMKIKKWPLNKAFSNLKSHRPSVGPNEGFMDQLRLFESMNCKLDKSFLPYKLYKLTQIHHQVVKAKILPSFVKKALQKETEVNGRTQHSMSKFNKTSIQSSSGSDVSSSGDSISPNASNNGVTLRQQRIQTQYKCKKCRSTLACSENVLPHWAGERISWRNLLDRMLAEESAEETINIVKKGQTPKTCQNGVFLEPLHWMDVCHSLAESRLLCAKCGAKIGTFAWESAVPCPCGASMAPGFHLNLNRVDKCTMHKDIEAVI